MKNLSLVLLLYCSFCFHVALAQSPQTEQSKALRKAVPDRLVVLTFDDSAKSHFTTVRPILLKYGFGATFFITEGWDFATNKKDYMSWEEIAELNKDGFEIGNHTRDHMGVNDKNLGKLVDQLQTIDDRCKEHQIPKPVSFAWPGNATTLAAFPILRDHGILFARRGGAPEGTYESGRGYGYQPGLDHSLLLPSAGDAKPKWELEDFVRAVQQAKEGRIAILQFHGVPDTAHDWVSTAVAKFDSYMHYLATEKYQVIALRDLSQYVDVAIQPEDAMSIIRTRLKKE